MLVDFERRQGGCKGDQRRAMTAGEIFCTQLNVLLFSFKSQLLSIMHRMNISLIAK